MGRSIAALALLLVAAAARAAAASVSPWAQVAGPGFVRVDTTGLPPPIYAVTQDASGFLWLGTGGGLARYDGYRFRLFAADPRDPHALPTGNIQSLVAGRNGQIYLGMLSRGIVQFDEATETFRAWHTDSAGRNGPRSGFVAALAQGPDGRIWIGGDGGLDAFDPRTHAFTPIALVAHGTQPTVQSLFVDREGALWTGTAQGLYFRPREGAAFRLFRFADGDDRRPFWGIAEDENGRLWVGSINRVFILDRGRHVIATLHASTGPQGLAYGPQRAIIEPLPGIMWIASTQGWMSVVDVAAHRVRRLLGNRNSPGSLSADIIYQWFRGSSGLIWVAGYNGGLQLYDPFNRGIYTLPADPTVTGLSNAQARGVVAAPDGLWVGALDGTLAELNPQHGIVHEFHLSKSIMAVLPKRDGGLWVGTQQGLCALDGADDLTCPAGPKEVSTAWIRTVLDTPEHLWIATDTGLVVKDNATGKVSVYHNGDPHTVLSSGSIRAMFRDRQNRIWVGTVNGLRLLDAKTGHVLSIRLARGSVLDPITIMSIVQDNERRIWAGAYGGPSYVLRETAPGTFTVRRIGRAEGLPSESIDALGVDPQGRIWASLDSPGAGIAVIDPVTFHARSFGPADGASLDENAVGSVTRARDGTIFFGGIKGVTAIAPGAQAAKPVVPPLVVTALKAGGRALPIRRAEENGGAIVLTPESRSLSVEFAALDYAAPLTVDYAYTLEGFDRQWLDADPAHRIATYTNLPPGDYTLRVRAVSALGLWSGREFALRVRALPAWYETWWFRALLAIAILLAGFGVHALRTAALRRRQRQLEALVEERTRELEQMTLTDPLTGLRNRRFLTQHLETDVAITVRRYEEWLESPATAPPHDADLIFFVVDIDHFKAVNDQLGHHAGDLVLAQMRERLEEVFRESDVIVRWGGEEFVAVARGSERSDAPNIAERLLQAVAQRPFVLADGAPLPKTISIGFAAFPFVPSAPRALSWAAVIDIADHALYMAKESSRNTWFGLAATHRTDATTIVARLATGAQELVAEGSIEVLSRSQVADRAAAVGG
jgi:diguanylate cyclase (GGDEF)-like protein